MKKLILYDLAQRRRAEHILPEAAGGDPCSQHRRGKQKWHSEYQPGDFNGALGQNKSLITH